MKLQLQRFAWIAVFIGLATAALAASGSKAASNAKERQAITTLQSGTAAEKALACKTLAVYGTPSAVPAIAPLLADDQLSSWARIALEAIPGRAADEALRDALGKVQGKLLVGVINSIGVRRDAKAVKPLTAKLADADPEVVSAAAVALGRIGGSKAVKALLPLLRAGQDSTRSAAAQGCILCAERFLAQKKTGEAAKVYEVVRLADLPKQRILEATRGAILARQTKGIPLLLEALRSSDKALWGIGVSTARELPGRAVTETLVAELKQTPPGRQGSLLLALADRNDPAVLPVVLGSARSGAKNLRLVALEILTRLADPKSAPVLFDTAVESDAEIAQAAKTALAALPAKDVDALLVKRLPAATGDARRALIELAGQRQVAAAMPELTRAANDSDARIRAAGIKALGEVVEVANLGALTDLLSKAKSDDDLEAVQAALESACTRITDKHACTDRLLASFAANATPAKCALLRVLGVVATPKALDTARTQVGSQEASLRDAAIRVLADWSEPAALPALLDIQRSAADETHRFLALRGCVRLLDASAQPGAEKVKTYGDLLARTQRTDDRKVLLSGLANVPAPAALRLAEPLLADAQVQAEAELAVLKIAEGIAKTAPAEAKAAAARIKTESKSENRRDRAAKLLNGLK